jgi:hypothetical protein
LGRTGDASHWSRDGTFEEAREGQKVARYVNDGRAEHDFFAETYDLLAYHIRPVPAAGVWGPPPEPAFRGTVFPRW